MKPKRLPATPQAIWTDSEIASVKVELKLVYRTRRTTRETKPVILRPRNMTSRDIALFNKLLKTYGKKR
jgi:hypothetical protein